jgi:hypothetical protein
MSNKKRDPWTPLRQSYPDSEKVNKLSFEAESLYVRVLARSDDGGNYFADPVELMCKLMSQRLKFGLVDLEKIKRLQEELVAAELVCLYKLNGGVYMHVNNPKKHLRPDVKPDLRFPGYSKRAVIKGTPDLSKTRSGLFKKQKRRACVPV